MKLIHRNGKVVATATDAYEGPDAFIAAPNGVDESNAFDFTVEDVDGVPTLQSKFDFQAYVVAQTQERLDAFARTRNYDGILSACTYATSANSIFQPEGQYCVQARDETWAKCYQILTEVQLQLRPMPTGYADIEAELPVLAWP